MSELMRQQKIQPQTIDDLNTLASAFAASGFFTDARTAAQCLVKMMAGQECGMGPFASMSGIHIIQGKPVLSATTVGGLIKRSGKYNYKVLVSDNQSCALEFTENAEVAGRMTFTMADAATAGLLTNPTWKKYPEAMLFSRALTAGARKYTPDVFGGAVYTAEELGAPTTEDGSEAVIKDVTPPKPEAPVEALPPVKVPLSITSLGALYADAKRLGVVKPDKLGPWLEESGIAPGLSQRLGPDGKRTKPTDDELINAEGHLLELIAKAEPVPVLPVVLDAPSEDGISTAQRMRIMAMFNAAGLKTDDERHGFSADVLGDDKSSTKTWTQDDYTRVDAALTKLISA